MAPLLSTSAELFRCEDMGNDTSGAKESMLSVIALPIGQAMEAERRRC